MPLSGNVKLLPNRSWLLKTVVTGLYSNKGWSYYSDPTIKNIDEMFLEMAVITR